MRLALPLALLLLAVAPAAAQEAAVPPARMSYGQGMDLTGRDLTRIFDTTAEACEAACLDNPACTAMTFNTRNGSCFPKAEVSAMTPYAGALSGFVIATDPAVLARAKVRAEGFAPERITAARALAVGLGREHPTDFATPEQVRAALREAEGARRRELAGALVVLTDSAAAWRDYAEAELARGDDANLSRAAAAALNGYLRGGDAEAASALTVMAEALERQGAGREALDALRRAAGLSPDPAIAAALEEAEGKYGFRITGNRVEADSAAPRICADFSEPLARAGVDYASFVQLPRPDLSVEAEGSQICVSGVEHGARYALTFRRGLPSAAGETLRRDVAIAAYVRDRRPQVSFAGRAYILPRGADQGLPVQTVNTGRLDLTLLRISDRNLVAAIRDQYLGRPLDRWELDRFADELAETVWTGTAEVGSEVNAEITTRLPVQEVTGALGPGIYALTAAIPGADSYESPPATQWFVISDLGLATWSGAEGVTVAVRRLSDAGPVAGAEVQLTSRANEVIGRVVTDADGIARFDARGGMPALVSVTEGEDMSFLSLQDAEFDLSDRGVAGRAPAPPIDVYLTTDRGAYRAGEVVQATILARDARAAALPGVPLTAVLTRPDGVEYLRQLAAEAGEGGHVATLPLAGSAPRGTWRLEVFADPKAAPLASARLLVEDFLPERIDFDLTLSEGVMSADARPRVGIEARYLFGAPGAGLAVEGSVRLAAATDLPGAEGYRFGRHDDPFAPLYATLDAAQTDDAGRAEITAALPEGAAQADRPLEARFDLRVREGSGRPVERSESRIVMPEAMVIGIRPGFDGGVGDGQAARFSLIALGPDAKPVAAKASWTLNRLETRYQWYALDGQWNWEPTTRRSRVAEGDAALGDAPAEIAIPVGWGEYEIVVESGGSVSSLAFTAGWAAAADAGASPDRLDLKLDRPAYRPGDTARARIVAPAAGVALVSVLAERVIALKAVPVAAGETVVDLPVTEDWGTGAYVTASVLRPLEGEAGRAPVRALGLAHAAIDPGDRRLEAAFDMAGEADPRGPLEVVLRTGARPGETVHATIAATDLGILNLTAFAPPDPQGHYFGQRRLGVGMRDLYGRLIDGRAGVAGVIRSGGDAGTGMTLQAPPPTEELVATFSGPLVADEGGVIRARFDLPAFNGTVRLAAVVWSKTGVGQAVKDVLVRDPVVVTASAPRFLAPGDRSRVLLEIAHATGPAGRMGLALSADGVTLGDAPGHVDLADHARAVVEVPVTAPGTLGVAQVRVALTTPEGRVLDRTLAIPVQRNDPAVARQSRFDLAAGQVFTLDDNVFAGLVPGGGRAILAAGPVARLDAPALLAALDRYPYGCTEQVASQAMPLLALGSVAEAMGLLTPADLDDRIDSAIRRVLTNQTAAGAFGLWSAEAGDGWLDAYATDFLSRARRAGHRVPDAAFRAALDNLRNQVNYAPDFDARSNGGGVTLAYKLMVLAREGAAAIGDLRYYADVKGDDFATPLAAAQLGAALAAYGDQPRADAMFARAGRMTSAVRQEAAVWRADYGTRLRDEAGVLALAEEAGSAVLDREAMIDRLGARIAGARLSTQEAAWSLLATQALIDRPGAAALTLNGQRVQGPLVGVREAGLAAPLAVGNPGPTPQVLTLTTLGVPEVPEPAGGRGWSIRRSYYTLEGEEADPARVAQGTRLVAVIEVRPQGRQSGRLMVSDPLPAGFEIDNPSLIRAGDIAALSWLEVEEAVRMVEFRQDRFLAALDRQEEQGPFRLAYILRAVSPGHFHHPAASVEDMYRPEQRAVSDAGQVVVE